MEKLILAQNTSNVDDTDVPSAEIKEREKKKRRIKAKRKTLQRTKSHSQIKKIVQYKIENSLLFFPQIDKFRFSSSTSMKETSRQHIENTVCNNILTNAIRNNEINMYKYNDKLYCFCSFQKMIECVHSFKIKTNVLR